MQSKKFAYIWEYSVDDQRKADFLAAYNSTGTWAQLFRRDETYLGTELLVDDAAPRRFVTIDYWTSKSARDDFRERNRAEFDELDTRCEEFTSSETFIGDFIIAVGADAI